MDLPEIFPDPHTLILDIRPLPAYLIRCLTGPHVASFFQWRLTRRILVYDADSVILRNGSNVLSLLPSPEVQRRSIFPLIHSRVEDSPLHLASCGLGGFQAVLQEHRSLFDPSPERMVTMTMVPHPSHYHPNYLANSEIFDPMFMASGPRDFISANPSTGPVRTRSEFVPRPSSSGTTAAPQGTCNTGPNVAYNPFYDTIRRNLELSHGITGGIPSPLKASQIAKNWIEDLPSVRLEVDSEG